LIKIGLFKEIVLVICEYGYPVADKSAFAGKVTIILKSSIIMIYSKGELVLITIDL